MAIVSRLTVVHGIGSSSGMPAIDSSNSSRSSCYPSQLDEHQVQAVELDNQQREGHEEMAGEGSKALGHLSRSVGMIAGRQARPARKYSGVVEASPLLGLGVPNAYPHPLPVGGMGGMTCCVRATSLTRKYYDRKMSMIGMMVNYAFFHHNIFLETISKRNKSNTYEEIVS
jgi:hypothetical protein